MRIWILTPPEPERLDRKAAAGILLVNVITLVVVTFSALAFLVLAS